MLAEDSICMICKPHSLQVNALQTSFIFAHALQNVAVSLKRSTTVGLESMRNTAECGTLWQSEHRRSCSHIFHHKCVNRSSPTSVVPLLIACADVHALQMLDIRPSHQMELDHSASAYPPSPRRLPPHLMSAVLISAGSQSAAKQEGLLFKKNSSIHPPISDSGSVTPSQSSYFASD
eukprot:189888-Rhodomonas_salina.1